mmetsp:Transcript_33489/g.72482  ORF Transcript_33489/g.72482 Transcript_33489/m.72482 type:complete len:127 (+) Transcript_33489:586-966(+)
MEKYRIRARDSLVRLQSLVGMGCKARMIDTIIVATSIRYELSTMDSTINAAIPSGVPRVIRKKETASASSPNDIEHGVRRRPLGCGSALDVMAAIADHCRSVDRAKKSSGSCHRRTTSTLASCFCC